jgi:membrane protease YdiL (CAAX protease family)
MVRFLRKNWLTLAILICAAALVPTVWGVINSDKTYLEIGSAIFMAGIIFALLCILFVGAASFTRKKTPKANE